MLQHVSYVLLDAARMGQRINTARQRNKANDSLYRGRSEERLPGVAPYIFQLAWQSPFSNWLLRDGWGDSWGIMLKSAAPMQVLHKHFRQFLIIESDDSRSLYFRFYDPRVLRIFLPTCDAAQIREFFGNAVEYFIVEDQDPDYALRFSQQNGILQTERFAVKDIIAALPEPEPLPPAKEDPLPPETIAMLKERGIVLPGMEGEEIKPGEDSAAQKPLWEGSPAKPEKPKPNTRWKLFD